MQIAEWYCKRGRRGREQLLLTKHMEVKQKWGYCGGGGLSQQDLIVPGWGGGGSLGGGGHIT